MYYGQSSRPLIIVSSQFSSERLQVTNDEAADAADEEFLSSDDNESDIDDLDKTPRRDVPRFPLPSVELGPRLHGAERKCRCKCHNVRPAEQKSSDDEEDYCE